MTIPGLDQGDLIRVRSVETRTFTIDYLRLVRRGHGTSSATLSSGAAAARADKAAAPAQAAEGPGAA